MLRFLSKKIVILIAFLSVAIIQTSAVVGKDTARDVANVVAPDTASATSVTGEDVTDSVALDNQLDALEDEEPESFHKLLKTKFIEGSAGFMSLVAMALVLGLAFCIERIIYLTLSETNAKKMMHDLDKKLSIGDVDGAKTLSRETRGPVAALALRALDHIDDSLDNIERTLSSYGAVEAAKLERGCSWITLFIAAAPSLGFLGTVIGMVMAFEQIQQAGDISPTIVASGMKVALITTIFGIIAALILQLFYNYILSKIDHITSQMEESAISLLESIMKYKNASKHQDV